MNEKATASDARARASACRTVCPECRRAVGPEHFACCSVARGGRVGGLATGAAKRRGDSAHYRALAARSKDRQKPDGPPQRLP